MSAELVGELKKAPRHVCYRITTISATDHIGHGLYQSQGTVKNPSYQGLQRSNVLSVPQIVHFRFFGIPSATPDPYDAAAHWPPWFTKRTKT